MLKHLKRRKLINPFSIFLVFITIFLFSITENSFSQLPQNLKLKSKHDPLNGFFNSDSVSIDTLKTSSTFRKEFAKAKFQIIFKNFVIDLPVYPKDSNIFVNWQAIDTNLVNLRTFFQNLNTTFGDFVFYKYNCTLRDTNEDFSKAYLLIFNNFVDIDSIQKLLNSVSDIKYINKVSNITYNCSIVNDVLFNTFAGKNGIGSNNLSSYPPLDYPNNVVFLNSGLQSYLFQSKIPLAWEITKGSNKIVYSSVETFPKLTQYSNDNLEYEFPKNRFINSSLIDFPFEKETVDVLTTEIDHPCYVVSVAQSEINNNKGIAGVANTGLLLFHSNQESINFNRISFKEPYIDNGNIKRGIDIVQISQETVDSDDWDSKKKGSTAIRAAGNQYFDHIDNCISTMENELWGLLSESQKAEESEKINFLYKAYAIYEKIDEIQRTINLSDNQIFTNTDNFESIKEYNFIRNPLGTRDDKYYLCEIKGEGFPRKFNRLLNTDKTIIPSLIKYNELKSNYDIRLNEKFNQYDENNPYFDNDFKYPLLYDVNVHFQGKPTLSYNNSPSYFNDNSKFSYSQDINHPENSFTKYNGFIDFVVPSSVLVPSITTVDNNSYYSYRSESNTSYCSPIASGIASLIKSVNRDLNIDLNNIENGSTNLKEFNNKTRDILTFTTKKVIDNQYQNSILERILTFNFEDPIWDPLLLNTPNRVNKTFIYYIIDQTTTINNNPTTFFCWDDEQRWYGTNYNPIKCEITLKNNQYDYKIQTKSNGTGWADKLRRSYAQRMGFGMVDAYRAVIHTIPNKADYNYSMNTNLTTTGRADLTDEHPNERFIHFGSKIKEGSWEGIGYTGSNYDLNGNGTIGNEVNVLEYGGRPFPGTSKDDEYKNNYGETILGSLDNNSMPVTIFFGSKCNSMYGWYN